MEEAEEGEEGVSTKATSSSRNQSGVLPCSVKERWRSGSVSGLSGQRKPEKKDVETKF